MPIGITLFIYGYTALIVVILILLANIVMNTDNMATDLRLSIKHRLIITIVTISVYYHLITSVPFILIDIFFYNDWSIQSIIEMKVFIVIIVGLITYKLIQLLLLHFLNKRNADVSVIVSTLVMAVSLLGINNLENMSNYVNNFKSQVIVYSENIEHLARVVATPGFVIPNYQIRDTYFSTNRDYIFEVIVTPKIDAKDLTFTFGVEKLNCEIYTTLDSIDDNIALYSFSKDDLKSCPCLDIGQQMYFKLPPK